MTKMCVTCDIVKATKICDGKFYCNKHFPEGSVPIKENFCVVDKVCVVDKAIRASYGFDNVPTHCNLHKMNGMEKC